MTYQPFNLEGKVAVITGGNGGIGLGMAQGIARAGGEVSIWGTSESKNAAALAQQQAIGPKTRATCAMLPMNRQSPQASRQRSRLMAGWTAALPMPESAGAGLGLMT